MVVSTCISFGAGFAIERNQHPSGRKWIFITGLILNLGLLVYFKYSTFISSEITDAFKLLQRDSKSFHNDIILPVGISFYIFQTTGYIIDVYHKRSAAETHVGRYALFVSFFPQLIAGPIERAGKLMPQFHFRFDFEYDRVKAGLIRFMWGFFKKLVVADSIAMYVNVVYASPSAHEGLTIWVATVLFLYQLYYDFSAYADMAIGLATILGVRLTENFTGQIPCYTSSFVQFWQNWHITLTIWIRDYLYIPLAKAFRKKTYKRLVPLLTFFLIGLWHGANWTFIVWGLLCGIFFVSENFIKEFRDLHLEAIGKRLSPKAWKIIGTITVFVLTSCAIVFFRAPSLSDARMLFHAGSIPKVGNLMVLSNEEIGVMCAVLLIAEIIRMQLGPLRIDEWVMRQKSWVRFVFYVAILELILLLGVPEGQDFIYFQF